MIQWLAISIGAIGTGFSAYMHFKIQNTTAVVPIKKVEENVADKAPANVDHKVHVHDNLDPVKLMSQSETNKNPKTMEKK